MLYLVRVVHLVHGVPYVRRLLVASDVPSYEESFLETILPALSVVGIEPALIEELTYQLIDDSPPSVVVKVIERQS